MQFGAKPLFENVNVKFGGGNRYGLIGANGCGKSTFMKILGGDLEPTAGTVAIDSHERVGKLRQDQFAFESERVLDVVLMGHAEMWQAMRSRDAIYANPEASEDDFMHAAEFEAKYAEYGGYTAEARAAALLLGLGVPTAQHEGPMSAVAPGWKLRVLLARALFGGPAILLLAYTTNAPEPAIPVHPPLGRRQGEAAPHRRRGEGADERLWRAALQGRQPLHRGRRARRHHRTQRRGQEHAPALPGRKPQSRCRLGEVGG